MSNSEKDAAENSVPAAEELRPEPAKDTCSKPTEEFRAATLKKFDEWLLELGDKADVVFISCACGQHQLTPRDIYNGVRDRTEDGEEWLQSLWELEQWKQQDEAAKQQSADGA